MKTNIYLLLEQTDVWIDREGGRHDVAKMSARYKRNVVRFLQRRAHNVAIAHSVGQIESIFVPIGREVLGEVDGKPVLGGLVHGGPQGEMAQELLMDELSREDDLKDADPFKWLRSTPLISRMLDDIAAGRGGEDD